MILPNYERSIKHIITTTTCNKKHDFKSKTKTEEIDVFYSSNR